MQHSPFGRPKLVSSLLINFMPRFYCLSELTAKPKISPIPLKYVRFVFGAGIALASEVSRAAICPARRAATKIVQQSAAQSSDGLLTKL